MLSSPNDESPANVDAAVGFYTYLVIINLQPPISSSDVTHL